MSDNSFPAGFNFAIPQFDFSVANRHIEEINRQNEEMLNEIAEERERKEAAEETYRQETIRSLRAIEQNTANLYTLVELISKSNEQQDELIELISEIMAIAKAKDKGEAKSLYEKTIGKISKIIKDGEALAKLLPIATAVYNIAKAALQ